MLNLGKTFFLFVFISTAIASDHIDITISYSEFIDRYKHLRSTTTEQSNPDTQFLSQTFKADNVAGLSLLLAQDANIVNGIEHYKSTYANDMSEKVYETILYGKQVIAIGAGSSGRLAVDIACKWHDIMEDVILLDSTLANNAQKVRGTIAGGKIPFVRPKEGVEDSQSWGQSQIDELTIGAGDFVLLISASGNAPFNVGAAREAHRRGAKVYYFHNSEKVAGITQALFDEDIATPLRVIIGPQAIQGSTRLQAATLAWLCWGGTLESVYNRLIKTSYSAEHVFERLIRNYQIGIDRIKAQLFLVGDLAKQIADLENLPDSNFFSLEDTFSVSTPGYITFLTSGNSEDKGLDKTISRLAVIETAELPPTYGIPRPPFTDELLAKECFFRCYQVLNPCGTNSDAWKILTGEKATESEERELSRLIQAHHVEGHGSYNNRPKGPGNLVFALMMGNPNDESRDTLLRELATVKAVGGKTGFIGVLTDNRQSAEWKNTVNVDHQFFLDGDFEEDRFGLGRTLMTKVFGNLFTNAIMLNLGKLYGNVMIDLNVSNYKLWFRALGIVQSYLHDHGIEDYSEENIFFTMQQALMAREETLRTGKFFPQLFELLILC